MSIPPKIANLTALALSDRILTYTERKTIVDAAVKEGVSEKEINQYLDDALSQRLNFYTKEELKSCPFCGAQIPLLSESCLFCGNELNNDNRLLHNPPPFIEGTEAEIIRAENLRVAKENINLKTCPDCGAPYPLISHICTNCGHVLHEQRESDFNIKQLTDSINHSISKLKRTQLPSWGKVITHYWQYITLYYLVLMLFFCSYDIFQLFIPPLYFCLCGILMLIGMLCGYREAGGIIKVTPLNDANDKYFNALQNYETYIRLTKTIYGDNQEAKVLLNQYFTEIQKFNTLRHRNITKIAIKISAFLIISAAIIICFGKYLENNQKQSLYDNLNNTVTLKPAPNDTTYSTFFTTPDTACLTFVVAQYDSVNYQMFYKPIINNIKIVASDCDNCLSADTITPRIQLLNRNLEPCVPYQSFLLDNNSIKRLKKTLKEKGVCYLDFVAKDSTQTDLSFIAKKAVYYKLY